MALRPLSIQGRSLLAASFVLAGFLGLAGFALDKAYTESQLEALRSRLQGYVWTYLSGSDLVVSGNKIIMPEYPPDPLFDRPLSGLYASVVGDGIAWESGSAAGRELPLTDKLEPNAQRFVGPVATHLGGLYIYSLGVDYAYGDQTKGVKLTFHVAEHESAFNRQVTVFRRTLWTWLGVLGVVLVIAQVTVLRWSLTPLRKLVRDLNSVERGEADALTGEYPGELERLTRNLNDFIDSEREQRARYRNTMADLAHSLKTPLAVLRNELENSVGGGETLRESVQEQVSRMNEIVAYQLSRGVTSGHKTFARAIELDDPAEEIVRGLEKVYIEKNVLCEFDIDPTARFFGEQGDLMELLGNLLENAFKWSRHRVMLTVRRIGPAQSRRPGIEIVVEDDGPGIPDEKVPLLLQRGVRGDERVQGHGIGLAIVQDIVRAHRGELTVDRSPELEGARFSLRFSPVI